MYTVTMNNTFSGLEFKFYDFDEMMTFVSLAVEKGTYTSSNGDTEPLKVIITFEEVPFNG